MSYSCPLSLWRRVLLVLLLAISATGVTRAAAQDGATVEGRFVFPDRPKTDLSWKHGEFGLKERYRSGSERRAYAVDVLSDGRFRAEGVEPGEYLIWAKVYGGPAGDDGQRGYALARTEEMVTVPEGSGEALDLGRLTVALCGRLRSGEPVPPFIARSFDGDIIRLADYRGKFVLLDFWATWCPPCHEEAANMVEIHDIFGDRDDFVIISLCLDDDTAAARKFLEESGCDSVALSIGGWSKTTIPDDFGVRSLPGILFIDPDGRLIASGLRGPRTLKLVRKTLEE